MKDSYAWHKDKLKGEYAEAFNKIELYGQTGIMDSITYEERMMDLVDIFAMAQEQGKPVKRIIGTDIEEFCGEYFGEYTWKDRIKKIPKQIIPFIWIMFIDAIVDMITVWPDSETVSNFWKFKTDVSIWLFILFGFVK